MGKKRLLFSLLGSLSGEDFGILSEHFPPICGPGNFAERSGLKGVMGFFHPKPLFPQNNRPLPWQHPPRTLWLFLFFSLFLLSITENK